MSNTVSLVHDVKGFIHSNGSVADKLRLVSAGVELDKGVVDDLVKQLESVLNRDGGVPFEIVRKNPSSVKETAEMIPLLVGLSNPPNVLIDRMCHFLISRQKRDGGFAEAGNLRNLIEDRYGKTGDTDWYPVGKSITWLTGKALEALKLAGFKGEERLLRARDFLLYSQYEDGHWPDFKGAKVSDPLGTGNILPALRAVGVGAESEVYNNGRAALFQHLKDSIANRSTYDMVDLSSLDAPTADAERDIFVRGLNLIMETQNSDGGWSDLGSKKSNPELSSLLTQAITKCSRFLRQKS